MFGGQNFVNKYIHTENITLSKMDLTVKIPGQKDFYSTIQEKSISKEEHRFASKMRQT